MLKLRIQLIAGLLFFMVANLQSQTLGRYFYIEAGTGSQSLQYKLRNGQQDGGTGSSLNVGFIHMYTSNLGLQTGLGIESCSSSATLNFMTAESAIDTDMQTYEFLTYYEKLKENQHVTFLSVPLGAFFRKPFGEKYGLMAMAGAKIAFPIKSYYEVVSGGITTAGYYDEWNVEMADMPRHGFFNINEHYSNEFSLNPSISLYADCGVFYSLSEKTDLYVGGFLNYGLNSISKSDHQFIYQQDGVYNGVLSSEEVSKTIPVFIGIKIGLFMRLGDRRISCW